VNAAAASLTVHEAKMKKGAHAQQATATIWRCPAGNLTSRQAHVKITQFRRKSILWRKINAYVRTQETFPAVIE
jgi:hypothetical protein